MSTVKQEPAGQEQPRAAPAVGAHHLDILQSMMNLIYLSSGRFIKELQSGGGTGRMKLAMQRAVPVASERFQDALDQLDNEVRQAQTVLRRDLALLKQDRKKREIAAKEKEAEKARLAAESRSAGSTAKKEEVKVEKVSTPVQPEPLVEMEPEKPDEPEEALDHEEEKALPPLETSIATPTERDPLFDGTPTTANPQENEFDFDAIFGDAMDTSGDNNAQDDMMDTSGDMGFDFDEGPSLLRGLEDFAKSGDDDTNGTAQNPTSLDMDITMPDLPDMNTSTEPIPPTEPPAPVKVATPPTTTQPVAETTTTIPPTDDAANNDTVNDDLLGDMVTDNLDDLFNMDEYENPEQSSFDDAFFNFDN
jgi:hypothetical protein